jgi:hypothetical protein
MFSNCHLLAEPLLVWGVFVAFVVNPLNMAWSDGRRWFLQRLGRIVCAPFYSVQFEDFWLADQFMSLILVFLDLEYLICFLSWDNVRWFFYSIHPHTLSLISIFCPDKKL